MRFLRQAIERKLSELLGMPVAMETVELALFKGAVTARGVTIGDGAGGVLLRIDAIGFEISIARALQKEIHVQSLTIERPVLSLVRRADGSWNVPRKQAESPEGEAGEGGDEAGKWTFDLSKLLLVNGQLDLRLETEGGPWRLSAAKVLGQVVRDGSELQVTLISDAVWVTGRDEPVGELKLAGRLKGFETFGGIEACEVWAELKVSEQVRLAVTTERLDSRRLGVELDAAVDVAEWVELLPPLPALSRVRQLGLRGAVKLAGNLQVSVPGGT